MRVVVATRAFAPEPAAAAWRQAALAHELTRRGHDVTVLTSRLPRVVAGAAELPVAPTAAPGGASPPGRLRVRRWPVLRDASGNVRGYVQYASFDVPLALRLLAHAFAGRARRRRVDVVVVEPPPTTGVAVRCAAALLGVPYVYYAADLLSFAAEQAGVAPVVLRVLRTVESWVLRGAERVMTVSAGYAERARQLGAAGDRVVEVGTGVDTDRLRPAEGPPREEPTLVYAGTMSEVQGVGVLVEALGRVLPQRPGARAVFYGGGVEAGALAARAAQVAPGQVDFRGLAPLEEVAAATASARAGLASQRPDTGYAFAFLVKPLASTACGTPVVYAGAGEMADLVREHRLGWAVAWDVDAVAGALAQALDGPPPAPSERARLAAWTRERFSLRAVAVRAADVVEAASTAG